MALVPKAAKALKDVGVGGVPIAPVVGIAATAAVAYRVLDTPQRRYNREKNTVGAEYDAWTEDGILEHYWGEHIHLGWCVSMRSCNHSVVSFAPTLLSQGIQHRK